MKKVVLTPKIQRLEIVLKYLKETKGLNQGQVGRSIGYSGAAITKMLNGEISITEKATKLFEHAHDISSHWFQTGEEEMFIESEPNSFNKNKTDHRSVLLLKLEKRKGMIKLVEALLELNDGQVDAIRRVVESYLK
ncbi:helix-turn-helix transcriptional regulator [Leptospira ellisii]|uniref:Helix-turn-helix transcriptional regulator n=1 Tax=Leptospira ellisii TaxID=2023197 RepID=A0AAE4U0A8_9LEPT|nr:helix-turn-helix transcriptional regulator [Leptospira ellisii]MDV6237499.1 helix-turn-helix transcriptional regulator [Leptospira ellisii]